MSMSPRLAQALVFTASLFFATSLSAQYHLGTRYVSTGSGSSGTGDTGSGSGVTGSGSGTAGSGGGETQTFGPGDTDLGGSTVTLAKAIFNGGIVSNGTVSASSIHEVRSGEVTAVLTGTAMVQKLGFDTFTLNSASTYAGRTDISSGTFKLGTNGSIASTPSIWVDPVATFDVSSVASFALQGTQTLSGSGTVIGPLTVASGTRLDPGLNPDAGTLTFEDGLTFASGSIIDLKLGSVSDLIAISSGLLAGPSSGAITLNLYDSGDFAAGTYLLFDFTGATLAGFDLADFTLGDAPGGYGYSIDFNGSTLELTASAVPEPATYALGVGAAALVAVIVRRRRLAARSTAL